MVQTSDGGYALTGSGCLVKTDSSGNMQWNQTYVGQTISLVQTSDGGYELAGGSGSSSLFIRLTLLANNYGTKLTAGREMDWPGL